MIGDNMKNKIVAIIFLCVVLAFFLVFCAEDTNNDNSNSTSTISNVVERSTATNTSKISEETTTAEKTTSAPSTENRIKIVPKKSDPNNIYDSSGFVLIDDMIPDVILDVRYATEYNFVGDVINGYEEPLAFLTYEAAEALSKAAKEFREKGYQLKIYDAYRPQVAVEHFVEWSTDLNDTRMKKDFYPNIDKSSLFGAYIAHYSGHSRGCTVDIALFDTKKQKDLDMGGTFDYFGELSHPTYTGVTTSQYNNRMLLRNVMQKYGFRPCSTEWWDFTYTNEPYPDTYFSFPVSKKSITYK